MKIKEYFILFLLCVSGNCFADTVSYQLSKNPFVKQKSMQIEETDQIDVENNIESLSEDSLRATLSAGEDSIANINGQLVFVGDYVNGYQLISVGIGSATLIRNSKEIILNVSEMHEKLK